MFTLLTIPGIRLMWAARLDVMQRLGKGGGLLKRKRGGAFTEEVFREEKKRSKGGAYQFLAQV